MTSLGLVSRAIFSFSRFFSRARKQLRQQILQGDEVHAKTGHDRLHSQRDRQMGLAYHLMLDLHIQRTC